MARTETQPFDLAIVGGGINGAGIARDAAGRGLSTCLIEQDDLAAHTSSASTKLIHGGLRYLEQGELRLVRESLAEREKLLAIAPHIVQPLQFVLPWVDGLRPRWLLRLGLFVYDHAGAREKLAASEPLQLPGTSFGAPLRPALHNGFGYWDCRVEDSRLVILNVLDAAERGARVLTRTRLLRAQGAGGQWQLDLGDAAGRKTRVKARVLVNAAGAWVNDVLRRCEVTPRQQLRLVQGSHLILRRLYEGEHAYLLQGPDRRVVFAIPHETDFTLVGTTDVPFDGDPARVTMTPAERDYLLECLRRFFRDPVGVQDIRGSYSGVRPLFDDGHATSAQGQTRDYHLELQEAGAPVLSVYGGKITTYRRLAEHALSDLAAFLPAASTPSWTGGEPLPGGDLAGAGPSDPGLAGFTARAQSRWPGLPPALVARLARTYGTRMSQILGSARSPQDLGRCLLADLHEAELAYLVKKEWARDAQDVLWRRTRLGLKATPSAVDHLQDAVAKLLR